MDSGVTLLIEGGKLRIDKAGFHLKPWFTADADAIAVPWSNIDFVCVTPGVERGETGWRTFRDEPLTRETLRGGLRFYSIMPALRDRHAVASGHSLLTRLWLRNAVWIKALVDANDKVCAAEGCMGLHLTRRGVRRSPESLIAALDLIEKHSRFDLIMFDM
jgi:hypothetical protein